MSLAFVQSEISDHLDEIKKLFKPPVKLTILVRRTEFEDGSQNMILTDDKYEDIDKAIKQRMAR